MPPRAAHNAEVALSYLRRGLPVALLALVSLFGLPSGSLAHGAGGAPAPSFPATLFAWQPEPLPILGVAVVAAIYLWAVRRVNTRHPRNRVPRGRAVAFLAGLGAVLLALTSPIEAYEGQLFAVHMGQHMLLELVAAPLLLVGAPITLSLRAASPSVRRGLLRVLQSRAVHVLAFPVVAWVLFAGVNWGWHFTSLYNDALESVPLHYLQHGTFMAAALLFWWPAIGADPSPWRLPHPVRLLYLFLAMPQNSFLGVALLSADRVLYPHYATDLRTWGPSVLDDQRLGGVIMWVFGDLAFLAGMVVVIAGWMRYEDKRTVRLDARLDAEEAARRAAAAHPASAQRESEDRVERHRAEEQRQVADRIAKQPDRGGAAAERQAKTDGVQQE